MTTTASERFLNLTAEKQERIVDAAVQEFAAHGFEQANTNRIARAAEISVGALFKYFATKDDLFLHVVHTVAQVLRSRVQALLEAPGGTLDKIEAILRLILESSRTERVYVELYHELTSSGTRQLTRQVALELESYTAGAYTALISAGQRSGEIRDDLPPSMLAFLLDNLFMSLQYAYACDYYIDRFQIYLGAEQGMGDDEVVAHTLAFLTQAVRKPGS